MIGKCLSSFFDSIRLLTLLPVPASEEPPRPTLLYWFPIVGFLIGLMLAGTDRLLLWMSPKILWICPILLVASWMAITRGLHIDGLADTFDALGAVGDKARRLEILRDPHVGSIGVSAVVLLLFAKIWTLMSLSPETRAVALLGSAISARWSVVPACAIFPYPRREGLGAAFIGQAKSSHIIFTSAATLLMIVLFTHCAIPLLMTTLLTGLGVAVLAHQAFGGITGDVLGAMIEIAECSGLCVFVLCS